MTVIDTYFTASDPLYAAKLFIDTGAITKNYLKLKELTGHATCAAVVKADAYGLGNSKVAPVLYEAGCRNFFVAQPTEGERLREIIPDARIMILNGLYDGAADFYDTHNLIPVLNTPEEIEAYSAYAAQKNKKYPALIHIDTGMNRLGLPLGDADRILGDNSLHDRLDILYVMSHLACADTPSHEKNAEQLSAFQGVLKKHPRLKASLANSAGIINSPDYHFDLARPGIALFGGRPSSHGNAEMLPVVHLRSRFIQTREVKAGESVGYGAAWVADKDITIGILPIGYADGFARLHGASTGEVRGQVYIEGTYAPIIGRVSMDLIAVDISKLASQHSLRNMSVELLGSHITIDDLAESAQTIGYEVLTNLGRRYKRHYADVI